jgi:hypothetical protein
MKHLSLNPDQSSGLKRRILAAAFLLSTIVSLSQTMFEKSYSNFARIRKFVVTSDGGSILAGQSAYLGNADMAMMKLDANGNVEWAHAYGNGTAIDMAESVAQTLDGGYILVGNSAQDCYVVKTNSVGVIQWQQTHTPTLSKLSYDVVQLSDSSYVIATGSSPSSTSATNAGYMRLDKAGNVIWSKSYGSLNFTCCSYNPNIYKILKLNNSTSLFAIGSTASSSSMSGYFAKFNAAGTIMFQKSESASVRFYNGVQTSDNKIVLVGRCNGSNSAIIMKIDTSGALIWSRIFNNASPLPSPQSIVELPTGDLLVYGYTTGGKSILIQTNSLGVVQKSREITNFNNTTFSIEDNLTIAPTLDGAFLVARDNKVKKIPLDIDQSCASAAATFSHSSTSSPLNTSTQVISTAYASPVKTFIDGSVAAVATSVCSSTYCAAVAQPATITGTQTICEGTSATYSVPVVSGASSYSWSLPGTWTGTSTTNSIIATAGTSGGTLSVFAMNSCTTSSSGTLTIAVNPSAAVPGTISGPSVICAGSNNSYSITPVSGATSYSWSLPGSWSGTSTTNSISITAGSTSGNISVSSLNGCGTSAPQTLAVTVNSTPGQPGSISGNTSPCAGTSTTYSVLAVAGATSYTWNLPSGWTGTSSTAVINVVSGSTGGNISVAAVNSCGTSAAQVQVLSIGSAPATPLSIAGSSSVCPGSSNTYSIAPVSGATSYNWSLPVGWSGTSTTNSISITAGSSGGTISVASVNSCGTSALQIQAITMSSTPAMPLSISGTTVVCPGTSNSYNTAPVSGATSYNWSLPGGWTGTSTSTGINVTAGASGGTISVAAVNSCGTSASQVQAIIIGPAPAMPAPVSGSNTVCSGSSNNYSVAPVNGASSYVWILPSGWSGTSSTNNISTTAGPSGGNIQVSAVSGCGTSAAQIQVLTVIASPAMPLAVFGNTTACVGTANVYSVTAVSGANSYSWVLPPGFTGTSSSNVIVITAGGAGGAVQVTVSNSCGSSGVQSIAVIVSALPNVQSGSNKALICAGETATLTANGASTYAWSTGASTQSIVVNPASTTVYTVTGTSLSGCVNTAVMTQSVSPCTGIEEHSGNNMLIYPNPTNGAFVIEGAKGARMIITTIFGQEIRNEELLSDQSAMDLSNEPNGVYFIQVEGRHVVKLVKN